MTSAISWIKVDETAKAALARILTERPSVVLPPPLHRLALRVGNVVEIVGPSPSAKTLILIQTSINCILPKEWKGVQYGGLERPVLFVDLDCRFDVLSLSHALERRITGAYRVRSGVKGNENEYDKELFVACMSRFFATLGFQDILFFGFSSLIGVYQTLPYRLQKEKEKQGSAVYMLMIDRKSLSLQTVAESIVQEIQRLLLVHPMLVLAAKSAAFGDKQSTTHVISQQINVLNNYAIGCYVSYISYTTGMYDVECRLPLCETFNVNEFLLCVNRLIKIIDRLLLNVFVVLNSGKRFDDKVLDSGGPQKPSYRDYMPSIWQSFVSHRILLRASDGESKHQTHPSFMTEWLLPPLKFSDKFIVNDV
ncbi:UNVERIFIED_CONTAM: DNA repair protein XRCC2 [Sesamum indicum]